MITVAQARDTARTRLATKRGAWAVADDAVPPVLTIALKPPSEREMLADERAAERWAREWSEYALAEGFVEWGVRAWRSIGRQRVPLRLTLPHPDDVAEFVGGDGLRQWRMLRERIRRVRAATASKLHSESAPAVDAAIRRHIEVLLRYDESEFADVVEAAQWLLENPVEGLRPRQLPIRGVDTKWFAAHRGVLSALHRAATGHDGLGIVDSDPLIRLRMLDEKLAIGGLTELATTAGAAATLDCRPRAVFVFENLESMLAMPAWPGAVVIHGSGYAVDVVANLPWVHRTPVVYWGDLDSNGFAILHRLRSHHRNVGSVLMDEDTLLGYRDLWVREQTPHRGTFDTLTGSERRALQRLRDEGDARLEQERIPWNHAFLALRRAWNSL